MSSRFEHLFAPLNLGPITLRNRIFATPHATMFTSDDRNNLPGETLAYYCAERAKGGAALVEVSMSIVSAETSSQTAPDTDGHFSPLAGGHPMVLTGRWPLRGTDERIVDGYSRLAKMVHEYGGRCFIELASGGSNVGSELGVSSFPWPNTLPFTSREMSEKDIEDQVEAYGVAAKYVRQSGLDGVDLHGTHGALISEFLSKVMNKRVDRYGGSLRNRMRFLEEVISRVRDYTKDEIAFGMRLMGDERFEGGNTPEDAAEIAKYFDGRLDWITADTGYSPQQEDWQAVPMYVDPGYNLKITNPVKSVLKKTKVGVVGRYLEPFLAERLIAEGHADMVAMTRALIADPELPNKARDGLISDIRPCIGALQDCWGRMIRGLPITCAVNPIVSREKTWGIGSLDKTAHAKKILIIGAGPAGLEAARVAAERGHKVVIYEAKRSAGGQTILAAKLPGRADVRSIINWQLGQLAKLGVEIKFGLEIANDPQLIDFVLDEELPDAVILATGSKPLRNGFQAYTFQPIEGCDQPNVFTCDDVLDDKAELGERVLVADTLGFIEAPGIAEYLSKRGKHVEIVTFHPNIALELKPMNHWDHLMPRVISSGIVIHPNTWVKKISGKSVTLYNVYLDSEQKILQFDNVILVTGRMQDDELYSVFQKKGRPVYRVGDANIGGARIGNAIYDGNAVARAL